MNNNIRECKDVLLNTGRCTCGTSAATHIQHISRHAFADMNDG